MDSIVVKFSSEITNRRRTRGLERLSRHDVAQSAADAAATIFEVRSLDERERAELDESPEYLVAGKMALSLIRPKDVTSEPMANGAGDMTWGIKAIGADQSDYNGAGVKVAVLDTGIDENHPAFEGVTLHTKNFSSDVPEDNNGHGTHCAGTIFGRDLNGTRIGVAPGITEAFIAKVIPGYTDSLINALTWAFENDVRVASMSLGIDFPGYQHSLVHDHGLDPRAATSRALTEFRANLAVFDSLLATFEARSLIKKGMVIVAATGNESRRPSYTIDAAPPSAAMGMIKVGAVQQNVATGYEIADFSNTKPTVVGPGVSVISAALGGGLIPLSGTSMATPHVAGLAALHWQKAHSLANASIISARLQTSVREIGLHWNDVGAGLAVAP